MNFEPTIEKEKLNELPVSSFQGNIIIVDKPEQIADAIAALSKEKIVGFDTETKPSFAKGISHKVALLQLATNNVCYLFRLNKIGFPPELEKFLQSPKTKKIGLSLRDDFSALSKHKPLRQTSFVDLQKIIANYGIQELSLQKIYGILFGKKISKSQRLSNWELPVLSEAQRVYAATDAWATLCIYQKLMEMPLKQATLKQQ